MSDSVCWLLLVTFCQVLQENRLTQAELTGRDQRKRSKVIGKFRVGECLVRLETLTASLNEILKVFDSKKL